MAIAHCPTVCEWEWVCAYWDWPTYPVLKSFYFTKIGSQHNKLVNKNKQKIEYKINKNAVLYYLLFCVNEIHRNCMSCSQWKLCIKAIKQSMRSGGELHRCALFGEMKMELAGTSGWQSQWTRHSSSWLLLNCCSTGKIVSNAVWE